MNYYDDVNKLKFALATILVDAGAMSVLFQFKLQLNGDHGGGGLRIRVMSSE